MLPPLFVPPPLGCLTCGVRAGFDCACGSGAMNGADVVPLGTEVKSPSMYAFMMDSTRFTYDSLWL